MLAGTVRYNDDAGESPDISWSSCSPWPVTPRSQHVRFTAGCANPVGDDGAQVKFDDLTINNKVIDFNKNLR